MKKLLLSLALIPALASAEYMPDGCYVAFNDTSKCWSAIDGQVQWTTYTDRQAGAYHYGYAIEAIMYQHGLLQAAGIGCVNDFNELVGEFNGLLGDLKKQKRLVTKLRKVCGSRCRSIK